MTRRARTNPIQKNSNGATGINDSGLASQRDDFSEYAHCLVGERLEVLGIDAGSSLRGHLGRTEVGKIADQSKSARHEDRPIGVNAVETP